MTKLGPNMQNLPIRTPEGRRIRAACGEQASTNLVEMDFSEIELRVLASLQTKSR